MKFENVLWDEAWVLRNNMYKEVPFVDSGISGILGDHPEIVCDIVTKDILEYDSRS